MAVCFHLILPWLYSPIITDMTGVRILYPSEFTRAQSWIYRDGLTSGKRWPMNCNHNFRFLPRVNSSPVLQSFIANSSISSENGQVLETALADVPRHRSCMQETLGIQASNEAGFSLLCLVCIFPCLIH